MANLTNFFEAAFRGAAKITKYDVWNQFEEMRRREYAMRDEIDSLRWTKLKDLLMYAKNHIPFYQNLWRDAGVNIEDIHSFEDYHLIPVVTKNDLIEAQQADEFNLSKQKRFQYTYTSGTTGPRMAIPVTVEDIKTKYANYLREYYATGWRLGVRTAALHYSGHLQFAGRYSKRDERDNYRLMRKAVFKTIHMRMLLKPWCTDTYAVENDLPMQWYTKLRKYRPYLLESMDFNIIALYSYIKKNRLSGLKIPKIIVLGTLDQRIKTTLSEFFDAEIFNRYGPHEIEGIAYECEHHQGLHIAEDCVHVEIIGKDGKPVVSDEVGEVVLTDLDSRLMPLIRYRIGDLGSRIDKQCVCGRGFELMADLGGRTRDAFVASHGGVVAPADVSRAVQSVDETEIFQVIQNNSGNIIIRLPDTKINRKSAFQEAIVDRLKTVLGNGVRIAITTDEPIELESNGKFCFAKRSG